MCGGCGTAQEFHQTFAGCIQSRLVSITPRKSPGDERSKARESIDTAAFVRTIPTLPSRWQASQENVNSAPPLTAAACDRTAGVSRNRMGTAVATRTAESVRDRRPQHVGGDQLERADQLTRSAGRERDDSYRRDGESGYTTCVNRHAGGVRPMHRRFTLIEF